MKSTHRHHTDKINPRTPTNITLNAYFSITHNGETIGLHRIVKLKNTPENQH